MLYRETPQGFVPWGGEALDDILYPRQIETIWSPEELAEVGLFVPAPASAVPSGKQVVSTSVSRVDGVVRFVDTYADIVDGPSNRPLTDRQLRIGLLTAGYSLAMVDAAIASIPNEIDREIAKVWWDRTTLIQWDHPMTQTLMTMVGIPQNERELLWMWASDIAA